MTVTVTDTRTEAHNMDSTTGVTSYNAGTLSTNTSIFAENGISVDQAVNIGTDAMYDTIAATDLSATMIYVWSYNSALQGGWDSGANSPAHGMYISDGTNDAILHMTGNDKDVFKHANGQVFFQCLMIGVRNIPMEY